MVSSEELLPQAVLRSIGDKLYEKVRGNCSCIGQLHSVQRRSCGPGLREACRCCACCACCVQQGAGIEASTRIQTHAADFTPIGACVRVCAGTVQARSGTHA